MNIFSFIDLLRSIYGKKLPDLEKIQSKGLLAVKIAQHYALRIDFLDDRVCRHLAKLYQNALSLPAEQVDSLLDAATEPSWRDNFQRIHKTPLASASIGQVHGAQLSGGGDVIVKIIKKDFRASFLKDLRTLRRLFKMLLFVNPRLRKVFDPLGILDHIHDYTLSELDLRNEIEGQKILGGIRDTWAGRYNLSRLRFHHLHSELSSQNVLVAERIRGATFDALLDRGELSYELLLDLFNIHGFYLFGPGIFHGDIHPGNIFLDENSQFCFIDTGAVSAIGTRIKNGLFNFFVALSTYDYERCAHALNEMAETGIEGKRFSTFKEKFFDLYSDFADTTVSQVSLTKKMMDTITAGVKSGMVFERGMFAIIKSLMYLDGMVLRCNPDAVLIKDMAPFIGTLKPLIDGPLHEAMPLGTTRGGFTA